MRSLVILFSLTLLSSCDSPETPRLTRRIFPVKELDTPCASKAMSSYFVYNGIDTPILAQWKLKPGLQIWLDTSQRARNLITKEEVYLRSHDVMTGLELDLEFTDKKPSPQKLKLEAQKLNLENIRQADRIHKIANQGQQIIWVANNSRDTVLLQGHDGFFIGLMQARDRSGRWKPIEFFEYSGCGNSFHDIKLLPGRARPIILGKDYSGNFKTKVRFKLLGKNGFLYSNAVTANINYCLFWKDRKKYQDNDEGHSTLETFVAHEVPRRNR